MDQEESSWTSKIKTYNVFEVIRNRPELYLSMPLSPSSVLERLETWMTSEAKCGSILTQRDEYSYSLCFRSSEEYLSKIVSDEIQVPFDIMNHLTVVRSFCVNEGLPVRWVFGHVFIEVNLDPKWFK